MSDEALQICLNDTNLCECLAKWCPVLYNSSVELKESCYMEHCFISKRSLEDRALYRVTGLYIFIFLFGFIGNVTTCLVMRRHPMMKTHANLYLINLAMSDLVTLCVGLPFEILMNWNQYPWPFPDFVCNLKALIAETTSSVSIITILFFAIERYVAICHPLFLMKNQPFKRNIGSIIIFTWLFSIFCAMPFAIHHRADYVLKSWPYTDNREPVLSSKLCMVAVVFEPNLQSTFKALFHFSAIAFFAIPLLIILILYTRIACKVSNNRTQLPREFDITEELQMRVNAILCAIVCAFFVCYLPFHMQRLIFFYVTNEVYLTKLNQYAFFISGFLFYLATIVNPVVYNLASSRFRKASKDILLSIFFRTSVDYPRSLSKYSLTHQPLRTSVSQRT